ncbi:MAG TPA: hypothetical protein VLA13_03755 [Massilibacterium sp.]|nr:hypothetical protein [Massilibacterium sp.]
MKGSQKKKKKRERLKELIRKQLKQLTPAPNREPNSPTNIEYKKK